VSWFSPERPQPEPRARAPLFQLLHTAPRLHRAANAPPEPALVHWVAPVAAAGPPALGLDTTALGTRPEAIPALLPDLASALSLPLDPHLPLVLEGKAMRPRARKALGEWLELLGNPHPLHWGNPMPDGHQQLRINHSQRCDAWRQLAQRLQMHPQVKRSLAQTQAAPRGSIVLVASKQRSAQHKRLNQLLRRASQELQLPLVKPWKLPALKQLQLFLRFRWLVGPYQPALQMVHALGPDARRCGRVALLCPSPQSKAVLSSMELVEAIPRRLVLLPKARPWDEQWQALRDALHWMDHPTTHKV